MDSNWNVNEVAIQANFLLFQLKLKCTYNVLLKCRVQKEQAKNLIKSEEHERELIVDSGLVEFSHSASEPWLNSNRGQQIHASDQSTAI